MYKVIFAAALLLLPLFSHAEFTSRNSGDIGFTSNANLTTDNEQSDLFYRISTLNRLESGKHAYSLRLSFMDYFEQNANDYLSLTAQDQWGELSSTLYTVAVAAQHFPNGGSGTSETAFNNYGVNLSGVRGWQRNNLTGDFGAGYRMRYYPSFEGRNDHNAYGMVSGAYEVNEQLNISVNGESGLTLSSLSDYSRFYAEISGSAEYDLQARWVWTNELTIGQSYFLDRSVSTQTRVSNKNRSSLRTNTSNERYTNISLVSEALRSQATNFKWGGGASLVNQSSLSNYQDYSVITLEAKLIYIF